MSKFKIYFRFPFTDIILAKKITKYKSKFVLVKPEYVGCEMNGHTNYQFWEIN